MLVFGTEEGLRGSGGLKDSGGADLNFLDGEGVCDDNSVSE